MLFNSFDYFVFLPIVFILNFLLPLKYRVWFLLLCSYIFYMFWRWQYVVLIIGQTEINYLAGLFIAKAHTKRKKFIWLQVSIIATLSILFFFKYFNFLNNSIRTLVLFIGGSYHVPNLDFLLPIGISFHTFQTLSYTIDLYRGKIPVEKSLARFALYVSFFPLLVAGPIERAGHLLPQFSRRTSPDLQRLASGARLILWGLFKKVVIADRLAEYVNLIYKTPGSFSGATLLLATYFFAFQIYCDFSGYTDIAIGSARMLGYDLMENFHLPYLATSISDFWHRWHISLSTWFRDYVYFPLGGNRVGESRWISNIGATFLLSGLWHGANWTFLLWGGVHGACYIVEILLTKPVVRLMDLLALPARFRRILGIVLTFHLVLLGWVFFRANTIGDAGLILKKIFFAFSGKLYLGPSQLAFYFSLLLIIALLIVMIMQSYGKLPLYPATCELTMPLRWSVYLVLLFGIALFGKSSNEFIYFQF